MSVNIGAKADHQSAAAIDGRHDISGSEILALADQIDQLGTAFGEIHGQLSALTIRIRAMAPADDRAGEVVAIAEQSALPVEPRAPQLTPPDPEPLAAPVLAQETIATIEASAVPSPADVFSDPTKVDYLQDILQSYRNLIAHPVKNEINRWITQNGGVSCEVTDDDRFHLPGGDAKGLLALIPLADHSAIILPAGRLVVDFTSNFANVIAMRAVTRHAFDLIGGDGGRIQLIEPAYATMLDGEWRLDRPGKVGGFSSD